MPGDPGDVGNWLVPLGVIALIIEGVVVVLAALVLADEFALARPAPTPRLLPITPRPDQQSPDQQSLDQ